ncbi:MAG: rane protein [Verrucomicrobiales bacterium]|nr:rane protein [Verrucomicrobiales bacterium]
MVAFMGPMLLAHSGAVPLDPVFACLAAQSVALVDVRGEYSLRLALMLSIAVILTGSTLLGILGAGSLFLALAGSLVITVAGGVWRHLSSDYGPGLAVSSGLMFFVAAGHPVQPGHHPAISALAGAAFGLILQVSHWPFRPQHPLRLAVAESWCALADLLESLAPDTPNRSQAISEKEIALRTALNQTLSSLTAAGRHATKVLPRLEALNLAAARLGMRALVFNTALEAIRPTRGYQQLEAGLVPSLQSLTQTARAMALAVVSRQPEHLTAVEVRTERLQNLMSVLESQISAQLEDAAAAQLTEILRGIASLMPGIVETLRVATDRAGERSAFSLELRDVGTLTLKPLTAVLNLQPCLEPALVHHTLRLMALMLPGVAAFKLSGLPHGYWLPFTMVVVLQPDFGATRQKAAERMAGTLIGGALASSLLWIHPPGGVVLLGIALSIALFAFFVKRQYGLAVIFVTFMVALLTESQQQATVAFTLERLGCTLAGGLLALGAALIFWPVWERGRFAGIMGQALHANTAYLRKVMGRLGSGGLYDDTVIQAKRSAESANIGVFISLRRMAADPANQRTDLESCAALANGNQRITRALSVIALHLNEDPTRYPEVLTEFTQLATQAFHLLAEFQSGGITPHDARMTLTALETFQLPPLDEARRNNARFREPWTFPQLSRIIAELGAMILTSGALLRKSTAPAVNVESTSGGKEDTAVGSLLHKPGTALPGIRGNN